jgi:hypothetical protein
MKTEMILIGLNLLVFLIAPYLPNVVYFYFVETYIGIILLLVLSLYSISEGYLVTVSTFIAIASLYSESHARKAKNVKGATKATGTNDFETQITPSPDLIPGEIHPEIESPSDERIENFPNDGENDFKPVDTSIDQKTNLPTISFSKDAEDIYIKENLAESSLKN